MSSNIDSRLAPEDVKTRALILIFGFLAVCAFAIVWRVNFSDAARAVSKANLQIECRYKLEHIARAIQAYKDEHGSFPPAFTEDESGVRLHSWRTLILPYLDEYELYNQIDLSQPWDAAANRTASETVVEAYRCPADGEHGATTRYFAVIHGDGIMKGSVSTRPADVIDGLDQTIVVVEGHDDTLVAWMEPTDIGVDEFLEFDGKTKMSPHEYGTHVAMADGRVALVPRVFGHKQLLAMLTASGGEPVDLGW